jgi:hypothetical protein
MVDEGGIVTEGRVDGMNYLPVYSRGEMLA